MSVIEDQYEGIAVIGMTGRFPGADNIEEFWANLVAGKESISFFSDSELAESGIDASAVKSRGHYVPARGVLKEADCFDAAFFGVHPKEAEVMDPQQRVFLEACWAALEHAGYAPNRMSGSVGVFGGATFNTYYLHALQPRPDLIELVGSDAVMLGNEKDYLTSRVAYKLGLKGPALSVSTACSTSLVAVGQACQSLLTFQCDIALAGGVSVNVPQKRGYYHEEGNISSVDGHTRTFDAQASGTVFSNGVGVVVLKRLEDAVKDRDRIYAVIKGAALNNDGSHRVSFGAPGVEGQSEVITMAHALAGVSPESISYVEAHGTATPLGDPIEVAALTKAFRDGTNAKQYCALGSVKTNIGHLDAASGVTGLIKTVLALHHKTIPASLHFTKPNAKLELERSPFYVNTALQEWKSEPGVPRRAGVSSFGTGGTNAHVVLEEAPQLALSGPSRPWQLLVLSAKTADGLDQATRQLSNHLKKSTCLENPSFASRDLADMAFTLQTGRGEFSHRLIVVCKDTSEGSALLESREPKRVFTHQQVLREPPVVFMFPGQGSQYVGMGAAMYATEAVFRTEVDRCVDLLLPVLGIDLRSILFPAPGSEAEAEKLLVETRYTQPALFVIEYALAKLWMSWGIKPAAMIGHSVGEYVAGCLSGVFSLQDALTLVSRRGALVQELPGGAMLAVRLPENEVATWLNGSMSIAAINSPGLCVVAGPYEPVEALEQKLGTQGVMTRRLQTSHAFHSSMMEPVLAPFTEMLRKVKLGEPSIPYVSNVTARWITAAEARQPEYWASHVRDTVRFADGVAELMKDPKNILLEVGPGQTLSQAARQHPNRPSEQNVLTSMSMTGAEEHRGILETLGRLWMNGVLLDWPAFYTSECRHRIDLPTYPFERKRYWPTSTPVEQRPAPSAQIETNVIPVQAMVPQEAESFETPVQTVAAPEVQEIVPRKDRLLNAARTLLQELSGYDFSAIDGSADLLELGLDSLLLTQAATLFQRKFGVSITFRQLMEELSSLDAIATHLDGKLPSDAFSPAPVAVQSAKSSASVSGSLPGSTLEQLLQQQQQLMNQLQQLMGRPPVAAVPVAAPPQVVPVQPTGEIKSHGPFKPIVRGTDLALSANQSRALEAWIARYNKRTPNSKKLAAENRPVLADPRSVSGFKQLWKEMVYPISINRSEGSSVWDVDGNEYLDFVMGFGASLFGHRPQFVVDAVSEQLSRGFEIGPIHPLAGEVAWMIREFTGMQRVGFTNTGSEAVLAATRVARTVTGRDKIAVFAGAYHGIFDEVLFRPLTINGETRTAPIAPGIPDSALAEVIVLDYGNPQSLEIIRSRGSEIAAVLVEPVQSRRLDLQPREFMHELRRITEQTGSALIFDEVVTGFRLHPGGAQAYFGVRADLATYGKVIGGGLPIGVVTGSSKFMDALDGGMWQYGDSSFPEVGVTFFAGTFVRHTLALAAAKAVLMHLKKHGPELQSGLADRAARLADRMRDVINEFNAPYHVTQFTSLIQMSFPSDQKFAGLLFYLLRERGIHIWENRAFVVTTAHTEADFDRLIQAFRESLSEMKECGFISQSPIVAGSLSIETGKAQGDKGGTFPLTEAQKEIWLAAQMGPEAAVGYNEALQFEFRGAFDLEIFRSAVATLLERHPILLASISADGQSQSVKPGTSLKVPLFDLSPKNEVERKRELNERIEREVSTPFDLLTGPLLRVRVLRLESEFHVVLWTAHHVICDGWSGGLLIGELAAIYSARRQGQQPQLPAPASFKDFALANEADTPAVAEAIAYWRNQFKELPLPLNLPTDRPRPAVRTASADTVKHSFDLPMYHALKRAAGRQRTTMVVLLMASLKTLLYRLSGQTDLVVGLGAAGQAITGNTCLVGHCLNTLPIRSHLQPDKSFQENLMLVKKEALDAFDHHQCTIGALLQHLSVPRSAGRAPLVEVLFNVDRDAGETTFEGLEFSCARTPKRALHFDLFFNFVEGQQGMYLECDYNTGLFDASTIERWMLSLQTLLEGIAANPERDLNHLPILSPDEIHELSLRWNQTDRAVPNLNMIEMFEKQAASSPEAEAVVFEGKSLSYAELNRRADLLALHLCSLGVGEDVLVGLCLERSIDMLVALLGVGKAGGAYVPLDPTFPRDRLAYMVEDSAMRFLVTHRGLEKELPVCPSIVVRLDSQWEQIEQSVGSKVVLPPVSPESLAYVLYTSGSTGKPKGVEITHSALVNFLYSMQQEPGFQASDTLLAVTTLSFDIAGLEMYLPLVSGGRVVIANLEDSHDPVRLSELIRRYHCTVMQATPATWRGMMEVGWKGASDMKILCGGEALASDLAAYLLPRCAELWNMYGPTETTIWSTIHRVTSADSPISIGKPIANTQTFILDAHHNLVPQGAAGELYIGGSGLARSYLRRPDLTAERFISLPSSPGSRLYRTGDLARWLPDGTLDCLGRVDNQVKIRGFRIELGEIETVLGRYPSIRQCVVVAREDTVGDKLLVAYFELQDGVAPTVADLRAHLRLDLPEYMVPSAFVPMEKLPLTPNGKIDRKALPSPTGLSAEAPTEFVAPRDPLEQTLARIWAKILGVNQLGVHDDFFELGGHSLAAVRMVAEVKKQTGYNIPLATLFQAATIDAFAITLRRQGSTTSWSSLVPMQPQGSKPPLFLVHGAEGNVLLYRQMIQYLDKDQPVYGLQSQGLNGEGQFCSNVNEMAAKYIKEILTVGQQGPFLLGGYCLGGLIAFEMAQQLREMGKKVELVVMFDTYNGSTIAASTLFLQKPIHFLQNLWFHAANFVTIPQGQRKKFLGEKINIARVRSSIRLAAAYHAICRLGGSRERHSYPHLAVKKINDKAADRYVPQPYRGRVAIIRPKGNFIGLASPSLGWSDLVRGSLEVHEIPVLPKGMLVEPFCRSLAEAVELSLRNA